MKLKELLEKAAGRPKEEGDCWEMAEAVGLDAYSFGCDAPGMDRLTQVWISKRMDSDTCVGLRAFYLDGQFAAVGQRNGRKSVLMLTWASMEAFHGMRAFIQSLPEPEEFDALVLSSDGLEKDMGEGYELTYASEALWSHRMMLGGQEVSFVRQGGAASGGLAWGCKSIVVRLPDGSEAPAEMSQLLFLYL